MITFYEKENGEKFFRLSRFCKVNGKYDALLAYEITKDSKVLITSIKFDESGHETPRRHGLAGETPRPRRRTLAE